MNSKGWSVNLLWNVLIIELSIGQMVSLFERRNENYYFIHTIIGINSMVLVFDMVLLFVFNLAKWSVFMVQNHLVNGLISITLKSTHCLFFCLVKWLRQTEDYVINVVVILKIIFFSELVVKKKAASRHEVSNSRLKNWQSLYNKLCHDYHKH